MTMISANLKLCRKWLTIVGCFMLLIPYGQTFFWGNMNVYCSSYLVSLSPTHSIAKAPWVLAVKMCSNSLTNCVIGFSLRVTGKRPLLALGIVLTSASYFLSYLAVQKSNLFLVLSFGVLYGISNGVVITISLQYAVEWAGNKDGIYVAFVRMGSLLGAIFVNLFMTLYVNPDNQTPDIRVGPSVYFSQQDILEKVPSTFAVLGCVSSFCQICGFLLVRNKDTMLENNKKNQNGYGSNESSTDFSENSTGNNTTVESVSQSIEIQRREEKNNNMTPKQMVSTSQFYILFFTFMNNIANFVIINNYYKSFGEEWITDDFFLTEIGTAIPIITIFTSLFWGMVMDKFGIKATLILLNAILSILGSFYCFTPQVNTWLYSIFTVLIGGMACPLFSIYNGATAKLFGKTYFSANVGIISALSIAFNLALSPTLEAIFLNLGWAYLFLIPAAVNAVALICVVLTMK